VAACAPVDFYVSRDLCTLEADVFCEAESGCLRSGWFLPESRSTL